MKKKIFFGICTVLSLVFAVFIVRIILNNIYIGKYNDNYYDECAFQMLEAVNVGENYIAPYNEGNVLYNQRDYVASIEKYNVALSHNPPQGPDCKTRINLALATVKTLKLNTTDEKVLEENIKTIEDLIELLCENGCADDYGDGHDDDAQQLKKDLEKLLKEQKKQLKEQQKQQQSDGETQSSGGGDSGDDNNQPTSGEGQTEGMDEMQSLENQLRDGMQDAIEERNENMIENYNYEFYYFDKPCW